VAIRRARFRDTIAPVGGFIRVARVRRMFRMVGEAREIGLGTAEAREHLLRALVSELGAAIGAVVLDEAFHPGGKQGCANATLAGFDRGTLEGPRDAHFYKFPVAVFEEIEAARPRWRPLLAAVEVLVNPAPRFPEWGPRRRVLDEAARLG
jgi:hypothetical protein